MKPIKLSLWSFMVFLLESFTNTYLTWTYLTVYNTSLVVIFFVLFQLSLVQLKTTFSFNTLTSGGPYVKLVILSFFSMAGVPPMIGFFTKVFLFLLICGAGLAVGFPLVFTILFTSLYFYIQNIRFLNASNTNNTPFTFDHSIRTVPLFFTTTYVIAFFLIFGGAYLDDTLLVVRWTLI